MSEYMEWQINCIGEIGTGTDCFVVTGPWQVTNELNPIIVIEKKAVTELEEKLKIAVACIKRACVSPSYAEIQKNCRMALAKIEEEK